MRNIIEDLKPPDPFPWTQYERICSLISKEMDGVKEQINHLRDDFKEEIKTLKNEIKDVRRDISNMDDCWAKTTEQIEDDIDKEVLDSVNEHNTMKNRIKELEDAIKLIKKIIYAIGGLLSSMFLLVFGAWVNTWF